MYRSLRSSGTPGAATYIKLRGTNSLTGNNQPLFVIDGIPVDNSQNYSGDPSDGSNNLLTGATNTEPRGRHQPRGY